MQALSLYAGPKALAHIRRHGLAPEHVRTIAAAAGGPKGLILGPLDRFVFGQWLPGSQHAIDLVGASIGAWRMATACMNNAEAAFLKLEHEYIHQSYEAPPGRTMPTARVVSEDFGRKLHDFFAGHLDEVLAHPRLRLHIMTTRGRYLLRREHRVGTPLGYLGAMLSNVLARRAMGLWLERVVFSSRVQGVRAPLPFKTGDYRTRQLDLDESNFYAALQASCSIPFVLQAVHDIPGAPRGAYWDGGISDYHLHLNFAAAPDAAQRPGLVLYPHFQRAVIPGWLDKKLHWRHHATHFLDNLLILAPRPEWVRKLPNSKLPDRKDFTHYGNNLQARVQAWRQAAHMSQQLAEEFAAWLERPDPAWVATL